MIPITCFEGRTVAVFGLARSGLAAARALIAGGARVAAWDENATARATAAAEGLDLVDLSTADWSAFAALMLSPGVPLTHPAPHWTVEKARAAGVEILGDIELFARAVATAPEHKRPRVIAITGTNGKSTTTALIGHVLSAAGRDTRVGGNIGVGVLGLPDMHGGAVYVLELSSYQLDLTSSLKPDVSILLNVSPDHLERHGGMEGYLAAKRRVLLGQGHGDTAIIGIDDAYGQQICTEITAANRRTIWPISARKSIGKGIYALQGRLYDPTDGRVTEIADLTAARSLPGRHNWQNAAAGLCGGQGPGGQRRRRRRRPDELPGPRPPHGDHRGDRQCPLRQRLQGHQRRRGPPGHELLSALLLDRRRPAQDRRHRTPGRSLSVHRQGLSGRRGRGRLPPGHPGRRCAPYARAGTLDAAVRAAFADARKEPGEAIVLFSPACASFDQYADFEERGEAFRAAVQALLAPPAQALAG